MERWAPVRVPGLGMYEASSAGRVRNKVTKRVLSARRTHAGYMKVSLWVNRRTCTRYIHRLVASAFLDTWDDGLTVDHINSADKGNNAHDNLRMATRAEQNANRCLKNMGKGRRVPVQQLTLDGRVVVATHESVTAAKQSVGRTCGAHITKCLAGKLGQAHGFVWRHVPHTDLVGEEWKPYNASTLISSMGRYRTKLKGVDRWSPAKTGDAMCKDVDGYPRFNSCGTTVSLHVAVAALFLPGPDDPRKMCVNHVDGNKLNAAAANLEWATRSENTLHAFDTGLNPKRKAVAQYGLDGALVARHASIAAAAKSLGCSRSAITLFVSKQSARGYAWSYV